MRHERQRIALLEDLTRVLLDLVLNPRPLDSDTESYLLERGIDLKRQGSSYLSSVERAADDEEDRTDRRPPDPPLEELRARYAIAGTRLEDVEDEEDDDDADDDNTDDGDD